LITIGQSAAREHRTASYLALAAVCILWGTTYLGIRIAIETLPPLYLIAIRYTISGGILLLGARIARVRLPSGRELAATSVCGVVAIGIGNGFLAIAETWVPSGLAALFYTTCPFWMVGIDALLPHGKDQRRRMDNRIFVPKTRPNARSPVCHRRGPAACGRSCHVHSRRHV
jgi:drug/metabolite transporter (DMT)-like permease